jgi:hypothetical protein
MLTTRYNNNFIEKFLTNDLKIINEKIPLSPNKGNYI